MTVLNQIDTSVLIAFSFRNCPFFRNVLFFVDRLLIWWRNIVMFGFRIAVHNCLHRGLHYQFNHVLSRIKGIFPWKQIDNNSSFSILHQLEQSSHQFLSSRCQVVEGHMRWQRQQLGQSWFILVGIQLQARTCYENRTIFQSFTHIFCCFQIQNCFYFIFTNWRKTWERQMPKL